MRWFYFARRRLTLSPSGLILYTCTKNYMEVRAYLNKTGNKKMYIRLSVLALLNTIFTIVLATWIVVDDSEIFASTELPLWPGWDYIHADFDDTTIIPYEAWSGDILSQAARWFIPLCAIFFFAFFGFAHEIWAGYGRLFYRASSTVISWASWVRGNVLKPKIARQPILEIRRGQKPSVLPMYRTGQPSRHNAAAAFSPNNSYGSYDSTFSLEEKYPWVATSEVGTLPGTPASLDKDLPARPAASRHFSPEESTQSFSSTKGLIPRV